MGGCDKRRGERRAAHWSVGVVGVVVGAPRWALEAVMRSGRHGDGAHAADNGQRADHPVTEETVTVTEGRGEETDRTYGSTLVARAQAHSIHFTSTCCRLLCCRADADADVDACCPACGRSLRRSQELASARAQAVVRGVRRGTPLSARRALPQPADAAAWPLALALSLRIRCFPRRRRPPLASIISPISARHSRCCLCFCLSRRRRPSRQQPPASRPVPSRAAPRRAAPQLPN